jgi:pilus assembly protein CpaE
MDIALFGSHDRQLEALLRRVASRLVAVANLDGYCAAPPPDRLPGVCVVDVRGQGVLPPNLRALRRAFPAASIIVVAPTLDPEMMLDAIRAGVNEFLTDPVALADLQNAIERGASVAPVTAAGKVFAFVGAKGGVGATTVAVNVATALAQTGRALFIDLHPGYGDAALFFGAEPRFSVLDALENTHRLDQAFFMGLVVRTAAGLDLLASSDRTTAAPDIQRVRAVIEFASHQYQYVVLDLSRSDMTALDALDSATAIVIVANQELCTVRSASKMVRSLRLRYGKDRVQIVVSRYDADSVIGQDDIERATGSTVRHLFPGNYAVALDSLNRGCPMVCQNHSKLAASLAGFARTLAGVKADAEGGAQKGAGLLGRLTGRR